jgi:uncharacterized membrane protein
LASRWLVWLGAVALAVGGFFLVKYAIDRDLLGPAVRVSLGGLFGALLVVAGEWLRQRPLARNLAMVRPSQVPPALTSAGLAMAFASIYAAYALYDFLPALVAFVLLGGVAAAAVALSHLQGPFVALLGILGGYLVPAIVSTQQPNAVALFSYVLVLTAGALAVVRYKAWWWLAWLALLGAVLWPILWMLSVWQARDAPVLSVYLLLLVGLFVFIRRDYGATTRASEPFDLADIIEAMPQPDLVVWAAATMTAVLVFALVRMDGYTFISLAALGVLCLFYLVTGRREPRFEGLAVLAAVLAAAVLATWHLPWIVESGADILAIEDRNYVLDWGPIVPPALEIFVGVSLALAALFGAAGFIALWGARLPAFWAALSAATPVIIFAVAYWRIEGFAHNLAWTPVGLALAALLLVAAQRVERHRDAAGMAGALGAYAVAVVAALGLALTTALEQAWLTVALAVQLPALAWIEARLRLKAVRTVALILASIVLVRLVLNVEILDYPLGTVPGLNWMLYGYGLPLLAFLDAARRFRARADDRLVTVLEAGALVFGVLLVTLEIRHIIEGSLDAANYSLLEKSLQSIAWLAIAYGLFRVHQRNGRAVPLWGWRILAGMATTHVVLLQATVFSPLATGDPVGEWPVLNLLLLAYGVPGVFGILFYRAASRLDMTLVARLAGVLALALFFIELSLEVRHAFHGSDLTLGRTTDAEWYVYSVAWLAYAGVLLALGLWRDSAALRWASLALVMLTVVKVFVFDMSELTGLYRAASFLGLGLALVGIGYLYQRFVLPRDGTARPEAESAQSD